MPPAHEAAGYGKDVSICGREDYTVVRHVMVADGETDVQWLIIALDGTDAQALERRMAARPAHLENAARLQAEGHLLVGGALVNDDGRMTGSACVAQFATRAQLDEWLRTDPYVTGNIWQDIQIMPYRVAPHYAFPPCPEAEPDPVRD
jgi:uncharacterized protein